MKTGNFLAAAAATLLPFAAASAPPSIGGCQIFPGNSHWNTPVDTLPVRSDSQTILNQYGTAKLHLDFGNVLADNFGIPFTTVTSAQPLVPIAFEAGGAGDESDPGPYPIPTDAPIEGGPSAPVDSDRHVLVLETTNCILYEMFHSFPQNGGQSWIVYSSAKWDLRSNALRMDTWTSADAAGLPILPGLVRWEEIQAGEINHAIRVTFPNASNTWIWPARHYGPPGNTNPIYPKYGMRIRLRSTFDTEQASFNIATKVVLRALKKYGFIYADQGSSWYFQGVSNTNFPDQMFSQLQAIIGRDNFEIVDTSPLQANYDSGHVRSHDLRADANGDGRGDVTWRNSVTGSNYQWQMNGMALSGQGYLPTVPTNWSIAALADFNGDGKGDVLWRDSSGLTYAWFMNGLAIASQGYLPSVPLPWAVAGMGDANADGKADVVWRNAATGDNYIWIMNGLSVSSQAYLPNVPGPDWEMVAVADFTGDRKADVLWRNKATGQVYLWQLDGLVVAAQGYLPTVSDPDWEVVGAPDADGDGKADVLWRNKTSGLMYLWLMNGLTVASQGYLPSVTDAGWKVVSVGDYDSDGRGDVLWRHSVSGLNYLWTLNGLTVATQGYLPSVSDVSWQPAK